MAQPKRLRLSVDEAKSKFDEEKVTFLDLTDRHTYKELDRRVEGAVRIAPEQLADQYERLPKEQAVLAY
jgi:hypothetical protein